MPASAEVIVVRVIAGPDPTTTGAVSATVVAVVGEVVEVVVVAVAMVVETVLVLVGAVVEAGPVATARAGDSWCEQPLIAIASIETTATIVARARRVPIMVIRRRPTPPRFPEATSEVQKCCVRERSRTLNKDPNRKGNRSFHP